VLKGKRDLRVDRPSLLSFYHSGSDIEMERQVFQITLFKIRFLLTGEQSVVRLSQMIGKCHGALANFQMTRSTRLISRGSGHGGRFIARSASEVAEVRILDRYRSRFNLGHAIQCETFPTLG
jgi:hypothetical protein